MSKILEALKQLDPANDNHWTAEGLPRIETVKMLASDQSITREQITHARSGFTRYTAAEAANANGAQAPAVQASTPTPTTPATAAPAVAQPPATTPSSAVTTQTSDPEPQGDEETSELDDVKAELAFEQEALAKLEVQLEEGRKYVQAQRDKVDTLHRKVESMGGKETTQDAISAYHAQQQRNLQARAERMKAVKESGIDFKTLLTFKAPIDQAMARKTGRGGQRPGVRK